MNRKCPCRRDCPDRVPGCSCEKREAWLAYLKSVREAMRRETVLNCYQMEAVRKSRKSRTRRRHRI